MAMGMMTLSAAFMKFAAEQRATMRDVRGNILNFAIVDLQAPSNRPSLTTANDHLIAQARYVPGQLILPRL